MDKRQAQAGIQNIEPELGAKHPKLNYTAEETRVHNKRMAKSGHIFLVVKSKGKGFTCSNYLEVPFGLTDDQKQEVHDALYSQLQNKYGV